MEIIRQILFLSELRQLLMTWLNLTCDSPIRGTIVGLQKMEREVYPGYEITEAAAKLRAS